MQMSNLSSQINDITPLKRLSDIDAVVKELSKTARKMLRKTEMN